MLNAQDLQQLEVAHKRIAHVTDHDFAAKSKEGKPTWEVVYRAPKRSEWKRFRAMLFNDQQKSDATEWLARACVVHPSRDSFDAMLEEFPGIGEASSEALTKLAGGTADAMGKS